MCIVVVQSIYFVSNIVSTILYDPESSFTCVCICILVVVLCAIFLTMSQSLLLFCDGDDWKVSPIPLGLMRYSVSSKYVGRVYVWFENSRYLAFYLVNKVTSNDTDGLTDLKMRRLNAEARCVNIVEVFIVAASDSGKWNYRVEPLHNEQWTPLL